MTDPDAGNGDGRETFDSMISRLAAQPLDKVQKEVVRQTTSIRVELESLDRGLKDLSENDGALADKLDAAAARDQELLTLARRIADQFEPDDTARHRREERLLRLEERLRVLTANQHDLAENVAGVTRSLSRQFWLLLVASSLLLVAVLAWLAVLAVGAT
ncbi:MAG: hypothetical protein ACRDRK_16855 [Pseudonocardia sp.]